MSGKKEKALRRAAKRDLKTERQQESDRKAKEAAFLRDTYMKRRRGEPRGPSLIVPVVAGVLSR